MKKIVLALMMVWMIIGMVFTADAFGEEIKQEHIYTVKKGDTPSDVLFVLWSFYKITPADVIKWNPKIGLHIIYPGQKIKYYLPKDEQLKIIKAIKSTVDRLWKTTRVNRLIFGIGTVFLIILILGVYWWMFYCLSSLKKKKEIAEVRVEINGDKYIYRPEVNQEGRYVSLHRAKGNLLTFQYITDLRKSVKKSFSQDRLLMEKEIKSGRLILVKKILKGDRR